MPKVKRTPPTPTRNKGERNLDPIDSTLQRILPMYQAPQWLSGDMWRAFVARQPVLTLARDTLISQFLSFDWRIEPVESDKRDELKDEIRYYENLFTSGGDLDYTETVEWIGADALDLPFGSGTELGRMGDTPNGKVMWFEPLDGATLFPTPSQDYPVGQRIKELPSEQPVYFPKHAINRVYYSPRREIKRKGWGMAPPEKIYLAAELLSRGDTYYANLLLDTPEAGILDLGDMEKNAAEEWVKAFRSLLGGIDPYKIPVIYEHNNEIKWIPFSRPPTELMYDKVTMKYAAFAVAGYGMSLSDIGLQASASGGETLAGSIRQERRTRRTGLALLKKKMKAFWDNMLPPYLKYKVIDLDDEVSVAVSRARLADATAASQLIDKGVFTATEMRQQIVADGLITIPVPENPPPEAKKVAEANTNGRPAERPSLLGKPVAPSSGGQGEVKSDYIEDELDRIARIESARLRRLIRAAIEPVSIETKTAYSQIPHDEMIWYNNWHDNVLWGNIDEEIPEFTLASIADADKKIAKAMEGDKWWELNINENLLEDFRSIFNEVRLSKLQAKAELEYEKGETDKLETEFELDKEAEDGFIQELSTSLDGIKSNWEKDLRKYIISGIRNALSSGEVATFFDENLDTDKILRDNRIVDYVRSELYNAKSDLTNKFAEVISERIKIMTEEL